jgi:hypothetical protein
MNSTTEAATVERVQADHDITKHLGHWTSANRFEVQARSGPVVLDLRSPAIQGDVEIQLDLHRSVVKLLLAEGDQVDHWRSSRTLGRPARTAPTRRSTTRRGRSASRMATLTAHPDPAGPFPG